MPKSRQAPIVLTLQQKVRSLRQRGQTLRMIAASSHDATARQVLIRRAEVWEEQAAAAERGDAPAPGLHA